MSEAYTLKISAEQAKEIPMVDLAFEVLKAANTPYYYRDLMLEIAKLKGLSENDVLEVIAQVYTEINIDGRFACVGNNLWGLKRWYPVEKADDAMGNAKRPRIINDDDDDLDDDDIYAEEEENYTAEEEDYDAMDEDREDFYMEEEDEIEGEVDEEIAEDEDLIDEDLDDDSAEDDEDEEESDFDDADDADEEDDDK